MYVGFLPDHYHAGRKDDSSTPNDKIQEGEIIEDGEIVDDMDLDVEQPVSSLLSTASPSPPPSPSLNGSAGAALMSGDGSVRPKIRQSSVQDLRIVLTKQKEDQGDLTADPSQSEAQGEFTFLFIFAILNSACCF